MKPKRCPRCDGLRVIAVGPFGGSYTTCPVCKGTGKQ